MYTPRQTKLLFKIIFEEDLVPIASSQQYHIYIIQIFIYVFLRERSRKSGVYAPIPLNIVCAVIHYLLFSYKK